MTQRQDELGAVYFKRVIVPYRTTHAAIGLCRWCPKPVATKRDGSPAVLCTAHLKYERQRIADRRAR